ncbi:MAG TPA: HAMP domain-containing sensor histidine kinase [Actinomycetota bacterium]|jgi:signal transduction histidine kinase|nr:HAMP domain-containing sensor histidine kinase [Actinomycetota bacterium]
MVAEGVRRRRRLAWSLDKFGWLEYVWAVFAVANLVAMWRLPAWETVPFHFIWISLTVVYGFRVWDVERTGWVLAAVVAATGALLLHEISSSFQRPDELTEVPLMAAVFLAMVWHARRRVVAMERERASLEANRRLLEGQRRFVQDASHELRTPITIAMGHADLLAREIRDPELAEDAGIVVDELLRLRRLADRLLLLASSADPDFLTRTETEVEPLLVEARTRWARTERRFVVERGDAAVVLADPERLGTALDALIENAVKQTAPGDEIRLGTRREGGRVAIWIADAGPGIASAQLETIFERFARLDAGRSRDRGGVGLGLAIVKAITEAHGGAVRVRSALGSGSVFEILLPAPRAPLEATAR